MVQYPDTIVVTVTTPPTEVNGIYTAGTSTDHTLICRAEPNSSGKKVLGDDGTLIEYSFDVFLPKMATVVPRGSAFVITSLNNGTITGEVKRAFNGQLNSRIWV
jgi:hypothetical protein